MRRRLVPALLPCLLALVLWPGGAKALILPEITAGPSVGTLGLGGEIGLRFNDFLGARVGGSAFSYDFDETFDDVDYDVDLDLGSFGPVLDVYPFGGGFRVTGGFRLNFNEASLTGRPNESVRIGDTVFTPEEVGTLQGGIDFNTFSPYLGIGYGASILAGLEIGLDLGLLYHGRPDVSLRATDGLLASDPAFQAEIDEERREIEDEVEDYVVYPVVGLSVVYRF